MEKSIIKRLPHTIDINKGSDINLIIPEEIESSIFDEWIITKEGIDESQIGNRKKVTIEAKYSIKEEAKNIKITFTAQTEKSKTEESKDLKNDIIICIKEDKENEEKIKIKGYNKGYKEFVHKTNKKITIRAKEVSFGYRFIKWIIKREENNNFTLSYRPNQLKEDLTIKSYWEPMEIKVALPFESEKTQFTVGNGCDININNTSKEFPKGPVLYINKDANNWYYKIIGKEGNKIKLDTKKNNEIIIKSKKNIYNIKIDLNEYSWWRAEIIPDENQKDIFDNYILIKNVSYYIKNRKDSKRRKILDDINLFIPPKSFVGLISGSGVGKSTLLNLILGIIKPSKEKINQGKIYFGEYNILKQYKEINEIWGIGYVPQDDILHKELKVEEALEFSLRLREPDLVDKEVKEKIMKVLKQVDLKDNKDNKDNEDNEDNEILKNYISKISGGQRKRVNMAMELLPNPIFLFLDEPTSGLDPFTDNLIMELLKKDSAINSKEYLKRISLKGKIEGKTIIITTHNINDRNLNKLDRVIVLAKYNNNDSNNEGASLAYYGEGSAALEYFQDHVIYKNTWDALNSKKVENVTNEKKDKVVVDSPEKIFNCIDNNGSYWIELYKHTEEYNKFIQIPLNKHKGF